MREEDRRETLYLHQNVLAKNEQAAKENQALFHNLLAINLMSSSGAGKTTLIQQLLKYTPLRAAAIVGDLQTDCDAQKMHQAGIRVVQMMTGNRCHLEAASVAAAAKQLDLETLDLLIIENVGNLVCPAMYHLGEDLRIVLMSVTEGEDKPLKYSTLFKFADAVIISKSDLAKAVDFDRERAMAYLAQVVPQTPIFEISAISGEGIDAFHAYLIRALKGKHSVRSLSA